MPEQKFFPKTFFIEWLVLLCANALLLALIVFNLALDYQALKVRERERLTTQLSIIQSHFNNQLNSIHNAQLNIRNEIMEQLQYKEDRSLFIQKRLRGFGESIPGVWAMSVVDKDGIVLQSNRAKLQGKDLSQLECFKQARTLALKDSFYIGAPKQNQDAEPCPFSTTTVLTDLNGNFYGAVITIIEQKEVRRLLSSVFYAADMHAAIGYPNGNMVLHEPDLNIGNWPNYAPATSKVQSGNFSFEYITDSDGVQRVVVQMNMQTAGLNNHLNIRISRSVPQITMHWRANMKVDLLLYALFVVCSIIGLRVYQLRRLSSMRREHQAKLQLEEKNQELKLVNQQLQEQKNYLQSLAFIDGLTKVANRRSFDETFNIEWQLCMRNARPLSLLMIDIDFFKGYNDLYGHQQGDECLQQVAAALHSKIKKNHDLVARYGGEEFVCLLSDTNAEQALQIAQRLRRSVERLELEHQASSVSAVVTVSIGCATMTPVAQQDRANLILCADHALYDAKRTGRNQVVASSCS